jgi:3-methylcrotonyl-CoA carboxylase beta subunit
MRRIHSHINTNSDDFRENRAHNLEMVRAFRERQETARYTRPQKDIDRLARQKKMPVRDRINLLLDPDTPFLELSSLAACESYGGDSPSASVVTGIGVVAGREVMINASDASVKGGAWYPLTVKKMVRSMEICIENHLPAIHIMDSAGAFLPMQDQLFPDRDGAGRIFRHQCVLSKMGVEQVALVMGHCTAGGAYIPTLCDYSIMVRGTGGVFLGGPPLVKAATGEDVTADELGGADVQAGISGTADYAVDTEEEAITLGREIVGTFSRPKKAAIDMREPEPPYYDPEELYGILPNDQKKQFDMREVIARIVDGSLFHEYKPHYGNTLVCGFAYLWGHKIGIVGNNGILFSESAQKATSFIQICDRDHIPLVFLQNITGFMVGKDYERRGITKDGAKMLMVLGNVNVPKFTIMTNGSFGAGNYAMNGRSWDPRYLFAWPNSKISVMGAEQAASTLTQLRVAQLKREGKEVSPDEVEAIRKPILEDYEARSSAYHSTSEIWDDGILDPVDTRNALGVAISSALNAPIADGMQYGVLRT